nr:hypothetical protein Iba_chr01cCG5700 [Ipomoea batatas]
MPPEGRSPAAQQLATGKAATGEVCSGNRTGVQRSPPRRLVREIASGFSRGPSLRFQSGAGVAALQERLRLTCWIVEDTKSCAIKDVMLASKKGMVSMSVCEDSEVLLVVAYKQFAESRVLCDVMNEVERYTDDLDVSEGDLSSWPLAMIVKGMY